MKQLILIKKSNTIDLAHLYEHIFCAHITKLFYNNHLFQHVDYSLVGKTYHGGVIYIELELYTNDAVLLADQIAKLAVDMSETVILRAGAQLVAESGYPFGGLGYDKIKQALENLHNQPWQNIDDFGIHDVKGIRRKSNPFYLSEDTPIPPRKLTTSVVLNTKFANSHRSLLPLFRQIAWLITANIQDTLSDTRGYFSLNDTFKINRNRVHLSNIFNVAGVNDVHVSAKDNLEVCLRIVQDLVQHEALERYLVQLRKISYYNESNLAPCLEKNYEDTLIFIGAKGWQEIATIENCELLLQHMSIEVKFGRQKASASLAGLR